MSNKTEAVTIDLGGAKLTVDTKALCQAWFEKHLTVQPSALAQTHGRPALKEGETYAGILLGKEGEHDQYIILLPGEAEDVTWSAALEWAKEQDGSLPTRREQALLFANLKEHFQAAYYWSSEQHASDESYAWLQHFFNGTQYDFLKSAELRARAVRRLTIQ